MCNLYSMTKSQDAIRQLFPGITDMTGNLPEMPEIFPDQMAPVVHLGVAGPVLTFMRWGMPSPQSRISDSGRDPGVTNIRNTGSLHWQRWLGVQHRCVVPFTRFSEPAVYPDGRKGPVWFALDQTQPLAFFAGVWTEWSSIRKVRDGMSTDQLFGFLTTDANAVVKPYHPKAMPVVLTSQDHLHRWLTAPTAEALTAQRSLPEDELEVVDLDDRPDEPAQLSLF